jgi:hypothetical protein
MRIRIRNTAFVPFLLLQNSHKNNKPTGSPNQMILDSSEPTMDWSYKWLILYLIIIFLGETVVCRQVPVLPSTKMPASFARLNRLQLILRCPQCLRFECLEEKYM